MTRTIKNQTNDQTFTNISQTTAFQSVIDEKDQLADKISLATEYLRQLEYLLSEAYKLVNKQPTIENYNLRTNLGIGVFLAQNALYDIDPDY